MQLTSDGGETLTEVKSPAIRMFREGFWAEYVSEEQVLIQTPDGKRYWINTLFDTCTCRTPDAESAPPPCEHLLGLCGLLSEQRAYEEAQIAMVEAQHDTWALTLENDRTERTLRELGVCEF